MSDFNYSIREERVYLPKRTEDEMLREAEILLAELPNALGSLDESRRITSRVLNLEFTV